MSGEEQSHSQTETTQESEENLPGKIWSSESLVSLLNSGREELRSYRTLLVGSTVAALLVPLTMAGLKNVSFLHLGGNLIALLVLSFWLLGVILLLIGFWLATPKLAPQWGSVTDDSYLTKIEMSLVYPNLETIKDSIMDIHRLLRKASKANVILFSAFVSFITSAGIVFVGFMVSIIKDP